MASSKGVDAGAGAPIPEQPEYEPEGEYEEMKEVQGDTALKASRVVGDCISSGSIVVERAISKFDVSKGDAIVQVMKRKDDFFVGAPVPVHVVEHGLRQLRKVLNNGSTVIELIENSNVPILLPSKKLSPQTNIGEKVEAIKGGILSFDRVIVASGSGAVFMMAGSSERNVGYADLVELCEAKLYVEKDPNVPRCMIGKIPLDFKQRVLPRLAHLGYSEKQVDGLGICHMVKIVPITCTVTFSQEVPKSQLELE